MKLPTEKPSEPIMKFFRPDLFIKFNSANDDEANDADEGWEAAIQSDRRHLDGLRDQWPSPVRNLADLCWHDAKF